MPGSALRLDNPGSNAPSVLRRSGHLPSAHILPGPASSLPLQTVFHAALIFTKLFLMLGAQVEQGLPLLQRKGGGITLHHGCLLCGACPGTVFFPERLSTSHPRPRTWLGTPRAVRAVRGTGWMGSSCPGEWEPSLLLSSSKCPEGSRSFNCQHYQQQ